jgi:3-oxoacyl-[acyl-carrier-protein] synthase II
MASKSKRIVITGLGVLTPLGLNVSSSWQALVAGKSGIKLIDDFDTTSFSSKFAGLITGLNLLEYLPEREIKKLDPFMHYGLIAGMQAVDDAGLTSIPKENLDRIGVIIGSGIGGLTTIEEQKQALLQAGPRRISPFFIPASIINMISGNLAIHYGFRGPNLSVATACTTGTHAIGMAARLIASGDADVMVAGGAEKASTPLGMAGFAAARALSSRNDAPTQASRPWDRNRDGFVLGDGAGVVVLEEYEHAKARGAKIYAELIGFGMSADAYHITKPAVEGATLAMRRALADAEISHTDIGYINAHGTSTPVGDLNETNAIKQVFQEHAYHLAISSNKSMIGHPLGAAGAIEAVFTALTLQQQILPPTINLDDPDPECDLDYVPHTARETNGQLVFACSNSFGFGGTNGTLVFKRFA